MGGAGADFGGATRLGVQFRGLVLRVKNEITLRRPLPRIMTDPSSRVVGRKPELARFLPAAKGQEIGSGAQAASAWISEGSDRGF
jgi:hypothetical protein